MYYVYILKGKKYYCWYTNDLNRRLKEHKRGKTITTKTLKVDMLIGYYTVTTKEEAENLERKIKDSGHRERRTTKEGFEKKESSIE